ncbi:MAG: hypothetical protein ACTS2F_25535 [Thainema sp.]
MTHQNKKLRYLPQRNRSVLSAIALGAALFVLPACNTVGENEEISEGQTNVTTEDVSSGLDSTEGTGLENVDTLIGQTVTVRSAVQETVGDSSFLLEADGGESILVVNATTAPFAVPTEEVPVQVTGEVAEFVQVDVENQYGLDLDDAIYGDYEGQPAIIADSLALAPTTEQLTQNPDFFSNQTIAIEGDVRGIYSPSTISLFEEGWVDDIGLLVVGVDRSLKAEGTNVQEGETLVVTGQAQPFDATALQQQYDLGLTPDQINEFTESYDRPVIVAEEIYPSAVDE